MRQSETRVTSEHDTEPVLPALRHGAHRLDNRRDDAAQSRLLARLRGYRKPAGS
jgi:hypothetical protein